PQHKELWPPPSAPRPAASAHRSRVDSPPTSEATEASENWRYRWPRRAQSEITATLHSSRLGWRPEDERQSKVEAPERSPAECEKAEFAAIFQLTGSQRAAYTPEQRGADSHLTPRTSPAVSTPETDGPHEVPYGERAALRRHHAGMRHGDSRQECG